MPLLAATWESEMLKLTDPNDAAFAGWPSDGAVAASSWGEVAKTFFSGIVVPPVASPAHIAAKAAFIVAFRALDGTAALSAGLVAYAASIAATVPTSTPPALPPAFGSLPATNDPAAPAASVAATVYAWAITGLGPTPAAAPWS